ncbi:SET domain-containing protein [Athelia psychrophila]|uniref:SET domain-containing protein n=1 Tax=Athelia psychrophila TaxID=1759441 RepID=A0A166M5W1_9AGAM|nr:SET domain-containing protein [Fibularhizoctonia sp. CBS 109695]
MSSAAEIEKEKGNDAFKTADFEAAHSHYTQAMLMDPLDYRFPLNRSIANLKLKRWKEAEEDATLALTLAPGEVKAYFRRSTARKELDDFAGARAGDRIETKKMAAMIDAAEAANSTSSNGFAVEDATSKGLGAFATRPFHRGDLILAERPLYILRLNILAAVENLSEDDRGQFHSLKNGQRCGSAIISIHETNAFAAGDGEIILCPIASRFNHSCSPNARYSWHAPSGHLRIFCLRDIAVGEEICVCYIAARRVYGSPRSDRQKRLETSHGFVCACTACTLPGSLQNISDTRRSLVNKIWESIPYFPPNQTTNRLREIVRGIHLLEEDGYAADADDFTNDAAAICAGHSDWESVKYWATKTYQTRVAEFGKDSPRAAEVLPILTNPRKTEYAGVLRKQIFSIRL